MTMTVRMMCRVSARLIGGKQIQLNVVQDANSNNTDYPQAALNVTSMNPADTETYDPGALYDVTITRVTE